MFLPKPKLAFLGRTCHAKTKSDAFLIDLLAPFCDLKVFRVEETPKKELLQKLKAFGASHYIYFQLPPSFRWHLLSLPAQSRLFIPMYDGFSPLSWKKQILLRWYGVEILAFCQRLATQFSSWKLPVLPVQYFPKPQFDPKLLTTKPPYTAFLWQRCEKINPRSVERLFPEGTLRQVFVKTEWESKESYEKKRDAADFFIAPRFQEGIGFSFIEAMARGKIVVGFRDATMDEYIQDGVTGLLFDKDFRLEKPLLAPSEYGKALFSYGSAAFARWETQVHNILKRYVCELA